MWPDASEGERRGPEPVWDAWQQEEAGQGQLGVEEGRHEAPLQTHAGWWRGEASYAGLSRLGARSCAGLSREQWPAVMGSHLAT